MNAIKFLLALSSATCVGLHLHHIEELNLLCLIVTLALSIFSEIMNYLNALKNRHSNAWEKVLDFMIIIWVASVFSFKIEEEVIWFGNYTLFGLLSHVIMSQLRK
jgi:hypothetical protein